ncbi:unnamed protein product [Mytilus coruscus]|uniref:Uncharacterized protein n=1 Tax=Mytilus coruscus TaxID=42192 RepID=A0A6J8ECQ7_MYTCO|nr:unnamed protein product [Mytilus coruscus]
MHPFRQKSFYEPTPACFEVENYLDLTTFELSNLDLQNNNFTKEQQLGLRSLRNMHDIVFSKSDKGGAIVISKKTHYKEGLRHYAVKDDYPIKLPSCETTKLIEATVLKSNYFEFNDRYFVQKIGASMGSKYSPEICDIRAFEVINEIIEKKGEAIRHHRNNSSTQNLKDTVCKFKGHLKHMGYKEHKIYCNCESALNIERSELLRFKQEPDKQIPLVFVTKYHFLLGNINKSLRKHYKKLLRYAKCRGLFPNPPMVALRNLKEILTSSVVKP